MARCRSAPKGGRPNRFPARFAYLAGNCVIAVSETWRKRGAPGGGRLPVPGYAPNALGRRPATSVVEVVDPAPRLLLQSS